MSTQITGRCACGAITYTCSQAPKFSLMCQCRQCQRITGAGHSAQYAVDVADTSISGVVTTFDLTSDAGNSVKSAFCGICGNPVYKTTSMAPNLIMFHAATLDDPGSFQAQMVVCSEFGQAWDHIDPDIPRKA